MREKELMAAAAVWGLDLAPEAADRLIRLADLVVEANDVVRLTAITDWRGMLAKHLLDSLAPLAAGYSPPRGACLADLGSGGGFPGLVLASVWPGADLVLIEAVRKKADFLRMAAAELGLANVSVWARRSEEAGRGAGREAFTLVTARAVAELRVLVELALPLLGTGGELLAWKGPEADREAAAAATALAVLGGEVCGAYRYGLPGEAGQRVLLRVRKIRPTPDTFPRRPGMAGKRPL